MSAGQARDAQTTLIPDLLSRRDEFVYKELCYKTKAFAEHLAQSMNLMDEKRSAYVLSVLENMIFHPNDDALIDRALCDLYRSGVKEGREQIEGILKTAKTEARARLAVGF
jgi:hypothetical protein